MSFIGSWVLLKPVKCYFLIIHSTWMWFIKKYDYTATYGAAVLLGVGGSTLLVTALTMLADLIGENVVSCLSQTANLNLVKAGLQDYKMYKHFTLILA